MFIAHEYSFSETLPLLINQGFFLPCVGTETVVSYGMTKGSINIMSSRACYSHEVSITTIWTVCMYDVSNSSEYA